MFISKVMGNIFTVRSMSALLSSTVSFLTLGFSGRLATVSTSLVVFPGVGGDPAGIKEKNLPVVTEFLWYLDPDTL